MAEVLLYLLWHGFRGAGPGCNNRDVAERLAVLQRDIDLNGAIEKQLDAHMSHVQQSIKNITDDVNNQQYPFRYLDILEVSGFPEFYYF